MKKLLRCLTLAAAGTFAAALTAAADDAKPQPAPAEKAAAVPAAKADDAKKAEKPAAKPEAACAITRCTLLTGYAKSNLGHGQKDYKLIPVGLRLPLWQKNDGPLHGDWEVNAEPYAGYVTSPNDNVEVGAPVFLRYGLPVGSTGLKFFVEAGLGPMYTTQRVHELGSKLNLVDMAGVGLRYALSESLDIELCWRFRNVTSFSGGVNGQMVILGLTYRY